MGDLFQHRTLQIKGCESLINTGDVRFTM